MERRCTSRKSCNMHRHPGLPYMDMERLVRVADGPDILAALTDRKSSLWYYISLVYFQTDCPFHVPLTPSLIDTLAAELLVDVAIKPLRELKAQYKCELDRLIRFISSLTPIRSAPLPPAATNERVRMLDLMKVSSVQSEHTAFLTYLQGSMRLSEDACCVCGGGESEPPDLIVICSGCETAVHMRCYGLVELPAGDWLCDMCRKGIQVRCGLCLQSGAALKPTIHASDWPYSAQIQAKDRMWAHLFCAKSIGASFLLPSSKDLIDLSAVSLQYWQRKCRLCSELKGAVVTCSMCKAGFHPECWRKKLCPRPPWGRILCTVHSKQISQQTILTGENKVIEEVMEFCMQISQGKRVNINEFTVEETDSLLQTCNRLLSTHYPYKNEGFSITINPTSQQIEVKQPSPFNLLSPVALLLSALTLPNRTTEQCYFQYLTLYPGLFTHLAGSVEELTADYFPVPIARKKQRKRRVPHSLVRLPLVQACGKLRRQRKKTRKRR